MCRQLVDHIVKGHTIRFESHYVNINTLSSMLCQVFDGPVPTQRVLDFALTKTQIASGMVTDCITYGHSRHGTVSQDGTNGFHRHGGHSDIVSRYACVMHTAIATCSTPFILDPWRVSSIVKWQTISWTCTPPTSRWNQRHMWFLTTMLSLS